MRGVLWLAALTLAVPCAAQTGENCSWSPLELNRIAYVDGKGDPRIACADLRRH